MYFYSRLRCSVNPFFNYFPDFEIWEKPFKTFNTLDVDDNDNVISCSFFNATDLNSPISGNNKNRKKDQQLNQLKQSDKSVNGGSPASEHSNKTGKTIHTTFHDVSVNFEYSTLEKKIWRRTGQSLQIKVIVFNLQRMPTLNKKCLLSSSKFCFLK